MMAIDSKGTAFPVTSIGMLSPDGNTVLLQTDVSNRLVLIRGLAYYPNEVVTLTRAEASLVRDLLKITFPEA